MEDIELNFWGGDPNETEIEKFKRISGVGAVGKFSPSYNLDCAMHVVMPTIGMGMKAEIHAALAHEPGIMLISINELRGKTRDEVKELLWGSILIDNNLHPEIEEEKGIFISKLMDISSESFSEKVAGRIMSQLDADITVQRMKDIAAFEIKARNDLEISHNVFERETRSTKSFIKKMNQEYAKKKYRK